MVIREIIVGPVQTCCYALWADSSSSSCLLIDPGDEAERIQKVLEGKRIDAILLTHGHFDHIGAVRPLMSPDTRLMIHPADQIMLSDPEMNASLGLMRTPVTAPAPTDLIHEGTEFSAAGLSVSVMHTPGHTQGSVCYRIGGELFTGDTLFEHGWGRTDLPGGDEHALFASLRRLMPLIHQMPFHPGHYT